MKAKIKILLAIFFIAGILTNCRAQEMDLKKRLGTTLPIDLNGVKIVSRFSDCGEWGGHKEEFLIQASSKDSVFCFFKMYAVNCDTAMKEGFSVSQKLANDTTFILNNQKVSSLEKYFEGMLSLKLSYKFPTNTCNYYGLFNSDSTLRIEFCGGKNSIDNYLKLKNDLGVHKFR